MNIELRRIRHRPETIDGQIWIEGIKVCDCAENAQTALPVGTYEIRIIKCQFHSRKMPYIVLSDNYEPPCRICSKSGCVGINSTPHKGGAGGGLLCPMLKPGNGVYNRTDGSIIVGKYLVPGCLSHPKQAFDALYDRIRKNIERGNPVNIIVSSI